MESKEKMVRSVSMEEIISLCKRRGFIFQSSEIYGGLQGIYDYGPLGIELKNHLKAAWWRAVVYERDDIEGLDSSIITHRFTLKHSGHEDTFTDPMVDCRSCKHRMRADHLAAHRCDHCGSSDLTEPRKFNLMLRTHLGPVDDGSNYAYLRPETAQGIFTNFKNVLDSTSRKLPFGIAQVGKAFRNEVTPKNFIFRVREFEQMEIEFFVEPGSDETWHAYWVENRVNWWIEQGLSAEHIMMQPQKKEELAHYSKATTDILYRFPFGWGELEGVANRTDFDLGSHTKSQHAFSLFAKVGSNHDSTAILSMDSSQKGEQLVPFVIEPSAGLDRGILAILTEAYVKETLDKGQSRIVLKLKPHLAPVKVAVLPLARNHEKIVAKAREVKQNLQKLAIGRIKYEEGGNVGKAYRKHDEIGTPLCITVDFDTFEGSRESVTVRDRDSMEQQRIAIEDLAPFLERYFRC